MESCGFASPRSCPCKADERMKDMPFQVDAHTNSAPLTGHPRRVCAGDSDFDVIWSSALRSPSGAVLQAEIWSCGDQEFTSIGERLPEHESPNIGCCRHVCGLCRLASQPLHPTAQVQSVT
jgi:hypothetical protein